MAIKIDKKLITKKYLDEYTRKIILPEVDAIVDKRMAKYTQQILTSNDKLAIKLDKIDTEVTSSLANYDRLSRKITTLEKTVAILAKRAGVEFNPLELEKA